MQRVRSINEAAASGDLERLLHLSTLPGGFLDMSVRARAWTAALRVTPIDDDTADIGGAIRLTPFQYAHHVISLHFPTQGDASGQDGRAQIRWQLSTRCDPHFHIFSLYYSPFFLFILFFLSSSNTLQASAATTTATSSAASSASSSPSSAATPRSTTFRAFTTSARSSSLWRAASERPLLWSSGWR